MKKRFSATVWDSLTFETQSVIVELENPPPSGRALAYAVHAELCKINEEKETDWTFLSCTDNMTPEHHVRSYRLSVGRVKPDQEVVALPPVKMVTVWESVEVFPGGTRTLTAECIVELR